MQTGVPLWIPLAVGLLGVLGVIVGQLLGSRREDRRWEREREREDLRWQREHEREEQHWDRERRREEERWNRERDRDHEQRQADALQETVRRDHQARIEWRLHRLEVYRAFLSTFDDARPGLFAHSAFAFNPEAYASDDDYRKSSDARLQRLKEAHVPLEILAGQSVRDLADLLFDLRRQEGRLMHPRRRSATEQQPVDWESHTTDLRELLQKIESARQDFLQAVRAELALESEPGSEEASATVSRNGPWANERPRSSRKGQDP